MAKEAEIFEGNRTVVFECMLVDSCGYVSQWSHRVFRNDLEVLLRALVRLQNGDIPTRSLGICANVKDMGGGFSKSPYEMISMLSLGWEHHSGNVAFPIKGSLLTVYKNDLWEGGMLIARNKLLDFLIGKVGRLLI